MEWLNKLKRVINTGQSRSVILTGNIYDLFYNGMSWVPLINLLQSSCKAESSDTQKGITQIVWRVNKPIEVVGNFKELSLLWNMHHGDSKSFENRLSETIDNSVYSMELLRQILQITRKSNLQNNMIVIIESADMLLPNVPIGSMPLQDRKRVSIMHDWLNDPEFVNGHDSVILISESRNDLHARISRLPQITCLEVPLPSETERSLFFQQFNKDHQTLARQTSGLSIYASNQLIRSGDLSVANINAKIEEYMIGQLGEGVVEFKRPTHKLKDVIGFTLLKKFIKEELIPNIIGPPENCVSGILVTGPIGGGKSFIGEAIASELDCPVILMKNFRSKWYGETDQIVERFSRMIQAFSKAIIFVDEADAMFGDISSDQETERRVTGKIQSMMSDPSLRGRIVWFLMTARPHRLSPDIRRSGRMDLIIPVLDPTNNDLIEFIKWTFGDLCGQEKIGELFSIFDGYSSSDFSILRSQIKSKQPKTLNEAIEIAKDMVPPDIADTRKYQTLQAKLNCTRKSLISSPHHVREVFLKDREEWKDMARRLEEKGVK